jgi:ribonuclease J
MAIDPFMKAVTDRISPLNLANSVGFVPHFIPETRPRKYKYFAPEIDFYKGAEEISKMANLTFMVRQTMEEFLKRLNDKTPLSNSTLSYSIWKGYKEYEKTKLFLEVCKKYGVSIVEQHTSGHAYREMLEGVVSKLAPKALIPIHTQSPEAFSELHNNVILLGDKQMFDLSV